MVSKSVRTEQGVLDSHVSSTPPESPLWLVRQDAFHPRLKESNLIQRHPTPSVPSPATRGAIYLLPMTDSQVAYHEDPHEAHEAGSG